MKRKKREKRYGPVLVLMIMIAVVSILSLILSLIGFESNKYLINNGTIETTMITVKNILSLDGFKFLIGKTISNFRTFEPLVLIIISIIGIGICEKSGYLQAIFTPFKRIKLVFIIFITIFLGVISSIIGIYSYIFLIPLIASMYKYLGKNPIIGVLVVFLGITIGYGTGLIFNYTDYSLALLTEQAAQADIDKTFGYTVNSTSYIMLISTLLITFIMTIVVNNLLVPKLTKKYVISDEEQELVVDKKAKRITFLISILVMLFVIYLILPINLPGAGILLDKNAPRYISKLFGPNSPFYNGLILIVMLIFILCGFIYGNLSGNIKNSHEFSLGLSNGFENLGFMFVLMFFICELQAVIEWTNIGSVISSKLIELIGSLQLSGILLIIVVFIAIVFISILLPGTQEKWVLASPVIVPLFMQSNMTPNFAQFVFRAADGVGKCLTPVFIYYIIMLAFLEKYRTSDKKQTSIFGVLKDILPVVFIMLIVWILIIVLWYVMGIPIGHNTYPTL